jgi:hypothetical protein
LHVEILEKAVIIKVHKDWLLTFLSGESGGELQMILFYKMYELRTTEMITILASKLKYNRWIFTCMQMNYVVCRDFCKNWLVIHVLHNYRGSPITAIFSLLLLWIKHGNFFSNKMTHSAIYIHGSCMYCVL